MRFVESVLALTLGVALLLATWYQATAVRRQSSEMEARAADAEARRVTGLMLDLDAGGVIGASGPNEIAVRAFRWWGRPCGLVGSPTSLHIALSGLRRPATDKDSVLAIDAEGRMEVVRLVRSSRSNRCSPGGAELVWERAPIRPPVLVRGFERGAYRLDDALRYRRGAGGAQPLTATRFTPDSVGLDVDATLVRLRLPPWVDRRWLR